MVGDVEGGDAIAADAGFYRVDLEVLRMFTLIWSRKDLVHGNNQNKKKQ